MNTHKNNSITKSHFMICPKCHNLDTKVIDSRLTEKNRVVRRRRECERCQHRFTSFERVEITNLVVVKKDDSSEPYDRVKLERGIWTACRKREIKESVITNIVNRLEESWSSKEKELKSIVIGNDVLRELKKIDPIAYIRFASVYKDFNTVEEFKNVIDKL